MSLGFASGSTSRPQLACVSPDAKVGAIIRRPRAAHEEEGRGKREEGRGKREECHVRAAGPDGQAFPQRLRDLRLLAVIERSCTVVGEVHYWIKDSQLHSARAAARGGIMCACLSRNYSAPVQICRPASPTRHSSSARTRRRSC